MQMTSLSFKCTVCIINEIKSARTFPLLMNLPFPGLLTCWFRQVRLRSDQGPLQSVYGPVLLGPPSAWSLSRWQCCSVPLCVSIWRRRRWERGEIPVGSRWQSSFITLLLGCVWRPSRGCRELHRQTDGKTIAAERSHNQRWQYCHSAGSGRGSRTKGMNGADGVSVGWNRSTGWRSERKAVCVKDRFKMGWNTWDGGDGGSRLASYRWGRSEAVRSGWAYSISILLSLRPTTLSAALHGNSILMAFDNIVNVTKSHAPNLDGLCSGESASLFTKIKPNSQTDFPYNTNSLSVWSSASFHVQLQHICIQKRQTGKKQKQSERTQLVSLMWRAWITVPLVPISLLTMWRSSSTVQLTKWPLHVSEPSIYHWQKQANLIANFSRPPKAKYNGKLMNRTKCPYIILPIKRLNIIAKSGG